MNDGCCNRRYARIKALAETYERNTCIVEKTVWQNEKDLTLDVPFNLQNDRVYRKGKKYVPDENLFASTNKMSRKVLVSATISWYGAMKPFFVNKNGAKVNKENYCTHLKKKRSFLQFKTLLSMMTGYLSKILLRHIDRICVKISL